MTEGKSDDGIADVLCSSYYWKHISRIEDYLRDSRSEEIILDPYKLFSLQRDIISYLSVLEQTIREGKKYKEISAQENDADKEREYSLGLSRNRALVRVIQSVADGLAWRLLKFDRHAIRVMSAPKKPRGSVDYASTYPGMADVAIRFMNDHGSRIIFNDITHYLSVGDLTELRPDGEVIIHELKNNGKTVKNALTIAKQISKQGSKAGVSKQMEKLVMVQNAILERTISLKDETVTIQDIDRPVITNLAAINSLISEARKSYFAKIKFGDYLEVYCMDFKATSYNSLNHKPQSWKQFDLKSCFNPSDIAICIDNYDSWDEAEGDFTRNKIPYSIFPFSVSDCMGLISGELKLACRLNLSELHRLYSASGWKVSVSGMAQLEQSHHDSINPQQDGHMSNLRRGIKVFTISRDGYNLDISLTMLLQIATDFLTPEMLLQMAETLYNTSERGIDRAVAPTFTREKDVWK